jgi:hypothetical protein
MTSTPALPTTGVELRSFKLRLAEGHVRIVPRTDAAGCPFAGPGVDLFAEAAQEAFHLAAPLLKALDEFEPGVAVRSLAVDLEKPRLTATLHAEGRPRVVRIDAGPALTRLLAATPDLAAHLADAAARTLLGRGGHLEQRADRTLQDGQRPRLGLGGGEGRESLAGSRTAGPEERPPAQKDGRQYGTTAVGTEGRLPEQKDG